MELDEMLSQWRRQPQAANIVDEATNPWGGRKVAVIEAKDVQPPADLTTMNVRWSGT